MSDLISRQAAIKVLYTEIIKRRLLDDVNGGMLDEFDTESIIRALPSVEPERCGDCINREALLRKLQKVSTEAWKMKLKCNAETVWNQCIDYVKDAPSVEPERKTGKWHFEGFEVWCTNCGFHPTTIEAFDYCPKCGAKMEVQDGKN